MAIGIGMSADWGAAAISFLNKLKPLYLAVTVALVASFGIFAPHPTLEKIGVLEYAEHYRPGIGTAFILSSALSVVLLIGEGTGMLKKIWSARRKKAAKEANAITVIRKKEETRERVLKRLHALTEDEKQILRFYIVNQTRTNTLHIDDGIVIGLLQAQIIHRTSNIPTGYNMAYDLNISEWAWDYLHKNKVFLKGETDLIRSDRRY